MSAHLKAQALRFLRVSGYAFVVQLLATGGHIGWSSLWSLAAGAAETALRQMLPVKSIPAVSAVLADAKEAAAVSAPPADPAPPAKG